MSSPSRVEASAPSLVRRLHATPHRTVYAFAGAGAQALAWLHAVGGSSRTVLEAHDHYHPASLHEALGRAPDRSASPEVAVLLARAAWRRAGRLLRNDPLPGPCFGLGLAATIATDRAKRGSHRVHVASADALGVAREDVLLEKGVRDRRGEEVLAGMLLLHAAADACGVMGLSDLPFTARERHERGFEPAPALAAFLGDPRAVLALDADGRPTASPFDPEGRVGRGGSRTVPALVSGSFHPLHEGHLRLAEAAASHLGREVWFELALSNAEKAAVDAAEARRRAAQAFGIRPSLLTHAPLFAEKAERLPGAVFVVGADTARRVVEPSFYDGEAGMLQALRRVRDAGCRFLVAGRASEGGFRTVADLPVPEGFGPLFEPLPEFRIDLSSTQLRAEWS